MVLIDDREDVALRRALTGLGLDIAVTRLEFGDACFEGSGPHGPLMVAIERKHLHDLVRSMQDRRLASHQLSGMARIYDVLYLVIEDNYRPTYSGGIEIWRRDGWQPLFSHGNRPSGSGVSFRQLDSYLQSLTALIGVTVLRSCSMFETASLYASRSLWWSKPWSAHHTGDAIYIPEPGSTIHKASFIPREAGLVERMAALLPGIDRKAWDVGQRFATVKQMVSADEESWRTIPGIGPETARRAFVALRTPRNSAHHTNE